MARVLDRWRHRKLMTLVLQDASPVVPRGPLVKTRKYSSHGEHTIKTKYIPSPTQVKLQHADMALHLVVVVFFSYLAQRERLLCIASQRKWKVYVSCSFLSCVHYPFPPGMQGRKGPLPRPSSSSRLQPQGTFHPLVISDQMRLRFKSKI